jgi:D-xylose transport system substrate-binding protein
VQYNLEAKSKVRNIGIILISLLFTLSYLTPSSVAASKTVKGFAGTLPLISGTGKVGFSIYNGAVPHWNSQDIPIMKKCLSTYAPGYSLISADPKGDANLQTTQVQAMLSKGIKVLILTPVASTPNAIVKAAKAQKTFVLAYANPPMGLKQGDIAGLVGDGPGAIGTAQGKWILAQKYPKGTKVALVNGDLATQYAVIMHDAQMAVLKSSFDSGALVLAGDKGAKNWDGADAQIQMAAILTVNPDVKAVIAGADFLAAGVITALKGQGLDGKVDIIGLDADVVGVQNILLGTQKATILKSSANEATTACSGVISLLNNGTIPKTIFKSVWSLGTYPVPFQDTEVKVIEKSELQAAIDWKLVTKEQMCAGLPATVGPPCS